MDIRAVEGAGHIEPEDENQDIAHEPPQERLWIIQCKREKSIGPTKVRQILKDSLPAGSIMPYGFILAAACDFSLKVRNVFHQDLRERGVQEGHLWGKAELEDMLFLPKFDYLLFAYFNISLQIRRRSLGTELRSRLTLKRKLINVLGDVNQKLFKIVLLRNPTEDRYPSWEKISDFSRRPAWMYATCIGHHPPDHLAFIIRSFYAYVDDERQKWDAMFGYNHERPHVMRAHKPNDLEKHSQDAHRYWQYWNDRIPENNRAHFHVWQFIHYDRILAVDEFGDSYNEGPHLLVEFTPESGPFEPSWRHEFVEYGHHMLCDRLRPTKKNRVALFPEVIPEPQPPAEEEAQKTR
jgi:hypothetical protein